jgi:GT2 family glycosyltransferase
VSIKFGVVVNYFSKESHPISVVYSAKFALSLLKNCPEVTEIVLSDGSASRDEEMERFCESLDIQYLHSGRMLSFAEGYNYGAARLTEEWIVTMASDIYVTPTTFTAMGKFIVNNNDLNIGCLIPYLSKSDLPTQQYLTSFFSRDCLSPGMTFNLNVFKKSVFESFGGMTKEYTGNFNDIEMWLKLEEKGLSTFLVGESYAVHYGQLTLNYGSNTNASKDSEHFYKNHPELYDKNGFFHMKFDKIFRSKRLKIMYAANRLLPAGIRNMYLVFMLKTAPILQRKYEK